MCDFFWKTFQLFGALSIASQAHLFGNWHLPDGRIEFDGCGYLERSVFCLSGAAGVARTTTTRQAGVESVADGSPQCICHKLTFRPFFGLNAVTIILLFCKDDHTTRLTRLGCTR